MPRREATRNDIIKVDEGAFVEGLWEDSPNRTKSCVEKSQLENVENLGESGILNYNREQEDLFNIDSLPEQTHHFATNKNLKYTPQFDEIVGKYGLNLDEPWNKELMKHRGKHPYAYHIYVLHKMRKCDNKAKGDVDVFISEFEIVKNKIRNNPLMLRKIYWKGNGNEILLDDV